MIQEYATNIAYQMGIELASVSAIECHSSGNQSAFLLILAADDHSAKTLVYQSELDELLNGSVTGTLDTKIRSSLHELKSTCTGHPLLKLY